MSDTSALSPQAKAAIDALAARASSYLDMEIPKLEEGMDSWEKTAINLGWAMFKPKVESSMEGLILHIFGGVSASDIEMFRSIFATGEAIFNPTVPQQ